MGYRPRTHASKKTNREYKKDFQKKKQPNKRLSKQDTKQVWEEKPVSSYQQVFEITLKRLHTLGNQKFGSSPFSEHFNRWLLNVETVLKEFESQPDVNIDEQFTKEREQVVSAIKMQLENRRQQETKLEIQINSVPDSKNRLQQTKKEYLAKAVMLKNQKIITVKKLNKEMEKLKEEQHQIIKIKTGFFRGITKKEREQRETLAMQRYSDKQQELEVTVLDFKERQKRLREDYENKCVPLLEEIKNFQKCTKEMNEDNSLEERWFACEALSDAVNNFFQRKISKQPPTAT
ncbi:MAG: hypothetical protein FWC33_03775 [Candidatus Bathyarchaeota archaeon]|nr:hypothetical protein [Candidatus Termiticorpusculum sp.]